MFRGFQIQLDTLDLSSLSEDGQGVYDIFKTGMKPFLDKYIMPGGALDGSKIQDDWFPTDNTELQIDCFISHAHPDQKLAIAFAAWLYDKFDIVAFIDSCIWGHADELLKQIDNEYCRNESADTYNYAKRNQSTAHVHLMLNNALAKMMDNCECVFFLRTPQSTLKDIVGTKTGSPWIYSEISTSQIIRKKVPPRTTTTRLVENFAATRLMSEKEKKELKVEYFLELDHLAALSDQDLEKWAKLWSYMQLPKVGHPLDKLYEIKPVHRKST
ncbi:hypothetical protein HDF19_13165 [Mucilaginibacter sp. E4BP6]|uniref:hypothetical protein n=1 Tax=Mucilaginibacter sp. E4BP6 TaxID=2723089 RepID=UPI0015CC37D4|nr:hypothetical protein [Mucilaginibacter sp. E4BP6]NYE64875.1 hypothetical protein [Mucilaginibacter sp. E4BP6]